VLEARLDPGIEHLLCLGAHADDIEIGCAGTIMKLAGGRPDLGVTWVVFSAEGERAREAQRSAATLLRGVKRKEIVLKTFRDGFFPAQIGDIKDVFEALKPRVAPDLVLTHHRHDGHQDHRVIAELTWNTFRRHLILEYEIPKYDGDLGSPSVFVPLSDALARRKVRHLLRHFGSQSRRGWFTEDLFLSLLRLRGMETPARTRYAEAFHCKKVVLGLP
jgi:LmbE family N-acetylglucosaminyl deacetylase